MATVAADDSDIREIEARFNRAWNRHDPEGMVETLTDDGQFVTVNGVWLKTRAEFLALMQRLHGANGPFRTSSRETLPSVHCGLTSTSPVAASRTSR